MNRANLFITYLTFHLELCCWIWNLLATRDHWSPEAWPVCTEMRCCKYKIHTGFWRLNIKEKIILKYVLLGNLTHKLQKASQALETICSQKRLVKLCSQINPQVPQSPSLTFTFSTDGGIWMSPPEGWQEIWWEVAAFPTMSDFLLGVDDGA